MKISNTRELQEAALSHCINCFDFIDFKDFIKIYKKVSKGPYSFLVNDTDLPSNNPLRFRKDLFK